MINQQAPEPAVILDRGGDVEVAGPPWYTLQGEGPFAGCPAIFIRLAGCNLQCPWCDTDYTTERHFMCPDEILGVLRNFPCRFVVITGGEPFRQNISVLVARLLLANYRVQIETNGMLYRELSWGNPDLHVVCCPKAASVSEQLLPNIMAWKYVIREGEIDPQDGLPLSHLGRKSSPARFPDGFPLEQVFVNPMDEGDAAANQRNLEAAADVCLQYGYRLGVQMHKLANLP